MADAAMCSIPPPSSDAVLVAEDLLQKCHSLLVELEEFKAFIDERKKENVVDVRHFQSSVRSELKSLEKISIADSTADRTIHTLRSSNLPFYIAVWDAAKSSTGLLTFNKRFFWAHPSSNSKGVREPREESVLVDFVAQGGLEWVKVSTVTEKRLLFDLAKAGWEAADSSSSDASSEDEDGAFMSAASFSKPPLAAGGPSSPSSSSIELVRLALELRRASRANLFRYRRPSIRFVLPKLPTHPSPTVKTILSQILATGATIKCGPSSVPYPSLDGNPFAPSSLTRSSVFQNLLPDPHSSLTPTVNIDCTILLALVSDLSHSSRTPHSPTHHQAITRQITVEVSDPLLPDSLYPAMEGRELVCTVEAALRMREIVQQIGTESERKRAWLLFGHETSEGDIHQPSLTDHATINTLLAAQSEYDVPASLRLPIRVVSVTPINMDRLPPIAHAVAAQLTTINQSVFLFGWEAGMTTVSSNRSVAKVIEGIIGEENERRAGVDGEEEESIIQGPEIWLCSTARSLVGKEKGRGGGRGRRK